eukprot:c12952_g1_i1.p1 GENE.c12952_g1_i1~~c12952_g1_i1.p1  ORF type:complete len:213 (+),score=31.01 c12952_g1_i1:341-979(+)
MRLAKENQDLRKELEILQSDLQERNQQLSREVPALRKQIETGHTEMSGLRNENKKLLKINKALRSQVSQLQQEVAQLNITLSDIQLQDKQKADAINQLRKQVADYPMMQQTCYNLQAYVGRSHKIAVRKLLDLAKNANTDKLTPKALSILTNRKPKSTRKLGNDAAHDVEPELIAEALMANQTANRDGLFEIYSLVFGESPSVTLNQDEDDE